MAASGQNWRQKWTARLDLALLSFTSFDCSSQPVAPLSLHSLCVPHIGTSCPSAGTSCPVLSPCADVCRYRDGKLPAGLSPSSLDIFYFCFSHKLWILSFESLLSVDDLISHFTEQIEAIRGEFLQFPLPYLPTSGLRAHIFCFLSCSRGGIVWSPRPVPPFLEGYCSSTSLLSGILTLLVWPFSSVCKYELSLCLFLFSYCSIFFFLSFYGKSS